MSRNYRRKKTINAGTGTSIGTIALTVFIILRVTNLIDWSWWWVLSPMWITGGFWLMMLTPGLFMKEVRESIYSTWIIIFIYLILTIGGLLIFA